MSRVLMERLVVEGQESLLATLKFAVLPIGKVFTVCILGFLMASKYVNILPASGRRHLNSLVFSLLLPCLIYTQLGQSVSVEKLKEWWFIPVNIILGSISGSLIGLLVASVVQPPHPYFKFSIIQIGIGNIGNIPLVLIAALCRDSSNPFGDSLKCSQDGTAYISFGQWVGAIILYTYVFDMLTMPEDSTGSLEEGKHQLKIASKNTPPEAVPLLADQLPSHTLSTSASTKGFQACAFLRCVVEKLKLKQIMQPPIVASALALLIGCIPALKRLLLTEDAPLFFLTDSLIILGEAMIPCILLALGGNLVEGPGQGSAKLGAKTLAAIIIGRLVLVPPAGLGIVTLADKLGFIPKGDKMFKFVLLLQHSMPTSVLAGAVANLKGCGKEAAAVLFWVHLFAIFSMAGWIVLYLAILF